MESPGVIVAFWVLSAVTVLSAAGVFLARDLIRALAFLVLSFVATAGLFLTLSGDFIAAAQILIYAGAIPVLLGATTATGSTSCPAWRWARRSRSASRSWRSTSSGARSPATCSRSVTSPPPPT
jgi:hypothetical protein